MVERQDRTSKRQLAAQKSMARVGDTEAMLRAELGLLFRIHALAYVTSRRLRQNDDVLEGLTVVAWRVLLTVVNQRGLSANEIVTLWGLEKMSVNRAVALLLERGLVAMDESEGGRRIPLKATDEGEAFYARAWPVAKAEYTAIGSVLTPNQLAAFNRSADRLLEAARKLGE